MAKSDQPRFLSQMLPDGTNYSIELEQNISCHPLECLDWAASFIKLSYDTIITVECENDNHSFRIPVLQYSRIDFVRPRRLDQ
jgi:hypothetical protein